jgi:hypothetical protein
LSLCSGGAEEPRTFFEFSNTEFHSLTAYKVFSCPRYTPAVMFFIEGLSKLYTLIAVSFVCFTTYGMDAHDRYTGSVAENLLLMMLFAQISYELGQLASCDWSLEEYFGGVWNILDVSSCVLLVVWALLLPFPAYFMYAKCAVALSAIPLAVVQLQYLSLIKTLGLLVLMIQSMIVDVYVFVVVYMVSIYGFTVCFRALFYTVNDYSSTGITFVTLFMSTLGGFNMDAFEGAYKMLGVVVMVVFLTLTNVLLVNLLIAQMSNTYNRIIFKSREEWTFIKVRFQSCNTCFANAHVFWCFLYFRRLPTCRTICCWRSRTPSACSRRRSTSSPSCYTRCTCGPWSATTSPSRERRQTTYSGKGFRAFSCCSIVGGSDVVQPHALC